MTKCPHTGVAVVVPCRLTKCNMHVKHESFKNCALVYAEDRSVDGLESAEIAFLHGTTVEVVDASIERAMKTLRDTGEKALGITGTFAKKEPEQPVYNPDSEHPAHELLSVLDDIIGDL